MVSSYVWSFHQDTEPAGHRVPNTSHVPLRDIARLCETTVLCETAMLCDRLTPNPTGE